MMLGYVLHALGNPLARLWLATSSHSWRRLPRPAESAVVHAPGADADRVLLLGSGITVGYGVVSHDLGLAGHLARELSAYSGRGATVNVSADPDSSPAAVWPRLVDADLTRFDALVLTIGGLEILTLMPAELWRAQLRELLERLQQSAPATLPIILVENGVPLLTGLPRGARRLVGTHAGVLNAVTRELAESFPAASFVAFDPHPGTLRTIAGRSTYSDWAALIAPAIAGALSCVERGRAAAPVDEQVRQRSLDALPLDSIDGGELDRIVANARDLFGTSGASVTIIDHDVQRTAAAIGMPDAPMPRDESICDRTIRSAEIFVVEDTMTDARVADTPWVDGTRIRFYAGYPVESPDGQRIGALCVVDTVPRTFTDTDAALLRQLALRVQASLWGKGSLR